MSIFSTHNAYIDFFKTLAENFTPIGHSNNEKHFARIIDTAGSPFQPYYMVDEFFEEVLSGLKPPYMLVESFMTTTRGPRASKNGVYSCGFLILDITGQMNDFDSINNVISSTEVMAREIIARADIVMEAADAYERVDWDSVTIHKVGPIKDEIYGSRVDFKVQRSSNGVFCVNDANWSDL